ncbi:putative ABC transporter ATP-binding protein [Posidoniimonas polymericola]|uniref:Energy-dependent translational throttle protein EttA n=1 Tax=Posidoniimonas polymericola TaxID=2528002 RepID=A0A5C5YS72_9BACT|nr:energy-dependent translational throttle protein EttA [Posidoniimonas polymericola]TWT77812.1 putative ABC transporter ATP-binding protein [Posidoniimonas polymericola]
MPPNQKYIYQIAGLTKKHGQREILKEIDLAFYPGAKIGVLGRNGAGKSTLLRIMAGLDKEYEGKAELADGFTVGMLEQEPRLNPDKDVRGNVEEAVAHKREVLAEYEKIGELYAEPDADYEKLGARQAQLDDEINAGNLWELDRQIEIAMDAINTPPADSEITKLSGGEKRRVALCKILLEQPDLLLLDEPTNHLDAESILWLEHHLAQYSGTIVAITHDRYFLDNVAQWILEIEYGRCIPFEGNYSAWLEKKAKLLETQEKQKSARQKTLTKELEWIRTNPKGRQTKNKARIKNYEEMAAKEYEERLDELEIQIPPGPRLGDQVVDAVNLTKCFGDRVLFENVNFRLPPGGIVGIIGPNGAGKTTLLKMLMGQEKPTSGELTFGPTVELGYVDQSRDTLDPEATVWEEISGGMDLIEMGKRQVNSRAYVSRFNFQKSDQQKKVGVLSGGERNRVQLAKLLRGGSNVLMLDEPTNDLDVDTLRSLEEAVATFVGCAIVVSHDRWFLDRLATHILAFEGDGYVHWCEGNFYAYEQQKAERLGIDPDEPKRFKYKKLQH